MADYIAAITTTVVLTGIFTYFLVRADFDAIQADWDKRRCEFPVMVMAPLLNPNDSGLSSMEFAQQNFSFCTQKTIQDVLKLVMAPFYKLLGQQVDTLNTMNGPLNSIRSMLKNSVKTFGKFMDKQYRQFSAVNAAITKTWYHLMFAMGRIQGIVYSVMYLGLSLSAFIDNTIKFAFNAILVFLGIMIAIIILLWFILFPVIPLIMTIIAVMVAAGVGAAAGMAGAFCIDPEAFVKLESGNVKRLKEVKLGDALYSSDGKPNTVTGILEVESLDTPLVEIQGVLMSESHRIMREGKWILAKDEPSAERIKGRIPRLICLNTTQHEVTVTHRHNGYESFFVVGDWEEVSDQEGRQAWIDAVWKHLNTTMNTPPVAPTVSPLVSSSVCVWKLDSGKTPIGNIRIGDLILSKNGYTKVKGVYQGTFSTNQPQESPEWFSDGVWILGEGGTWNPAGKAGVQQCEGTIKTSGYFLVTEAEEFFLELNGVQQLVRDFTEIGASQIHQTYEMLDTCVNKK
jgi:hypothetical protein